MKKCPHMLLEIKSGCCSCLALAGAEAAVCDCALSNCQLLCQKCRLTCCSLLHARSYSFQQLRAGNMPQTAAHSRPRSCLSLLSPSLILMASSFYPPTQHSLFSDLNKQLTQSSKFDFLDGPSGEWGGQSHTILPILPRSVFLLGAQKSSMAGWWVQGRLNHYFLFLWSRLLSPAPQWCYHHKVFFFFYESESVSHSAVSYSLWPHRPHQAPLCMEFSTQEHWSGLPFPSPGDLPNLGIEPGFPAL